MRGYSPLGHHDKQDDRKRRYLSRSPSRRSRSRERKTIKARSRSVSRSCTRSRSRSPVKHRERHKYSPYRQSKKVKAEYDPFGRTLRDSRRKDKNEKDYPLTYSSYYDHDVYGDSRHKTYSRRESFEDERDPDLRYRSLGYDRGYGRHYKHYRSSDFWYNDAYHREDFENARRYTDLHKERRPSGSFLDYDYDGEFYDGNSTDVHAGGGSMMTFQQFIGTLNNDVEESAAAKRYTEYKNNFAKSAILEFYEEHAEQDWFKDKYDPEQIEKANAELSAMVSFRLQALREFLTDACDFEEDVLSLDSLNTLNVLKFLSKVRNRTNELLEIDVRLKRGETIETIQQSIERSKCNREGNAVTSEVNVVEESREESHDTVKELGETEEVREAGEEEENSQGKPSKKKGNGKEFYNNDFIMKLYNIHEPIGFIKPVPPVISPHQIRACLLENNIPFIDLSFSAPLPIRKFYRMVWVTFDSTVSHEEKSILEACNRVNNLAIPFPTENSGKSPEEGSNALETHYFFLRCTINRRNRLNRIRTYSQPDLERSRKDLKQLCSLCEHFNDSRQVDAAVYNGLLRQGPADENSLTDVLKAVDRLVIYLRAVHCYCYFSGYVCDSVEELRHQCGDVHVRLSGSPGHYQYRTDWEKIADEAFARIMKPKLSVEEATPLGYKDCEEEEKNFLDSKIMKLEKEKFKCAICGKCFKGYEYVERHIPYRHSSDLIEHRNKTLRFNNFVLDPCRPSNVFAPKYYSVYPYAPFIAGMGSVAPPVSFYPPYSPFMVQSYAGPYGRLKQYSGPALAGALHYPSPYYPHPANRFQRPVFSAVPFSRNPYRGGYHGREAHYDAYGQRAFSNRHRHVRLPPPGVVEDPRQQNIKRYVDLDAPVSDDVVDYRGVINQPEE